MEMEKRMDEEFELDERKTKILDAIIRNYLETGEPVGSRTISKYTDLNLSSATIRNEMADLEELGYIYNENEPVNLGRTLVLPPKYLDPIAPGEGMKLLRCEDTISIHHYSASWMGNKTRLKRRIIRIIGQENVSKIKQFCQRLKMG